MGIIVVNVNVDCPTLTRVVGELDDGEDAEVVPVLLVRGVRAGEAGEAGEADQHQLGHTTRHAESQS